MKNHRRLISLSVICILLIGCAWWILHEPDPWYGGKSVRYWTSQAGHWDLEEQAAAREALRAMGQSAVPYLIKTLEQQESSITRKLRSYAPCYPFLNVLLPDPDNQQRAQAARALGEIGPPASNAIPALKVASKVKNNAQPHAIAALMKIRGESAESHIQSLGLDSINGRSNHDVEAWANVVVTTALGDFGPEAKTAIPELRRHVNDTDKVYRYFALICICHILPLNEVKPEEIKALVPLLNTKLKDPDPRIRTDAANILKKINAAAAKAQSR